MCISWSIVSPARKLSLVGPLPGANVKSYAGYLTVNKKYNSNLYFWFFPAQVQWTYPKLRYITVYWLISSLVKKWGWMPSLSEIKCCNMETLTQKDCLWI